MKLNTCYLSLSIALQVMALVFTVEHCSPLCVRHDTRGVSSPLLLFILLYESDHMVEYKERISNFKNALLALKMKVTENSSQKYMHIMRCFITDRYTPLSHVLLTRKKKQDHILIFFSLFDVMSIHF